MLTIVLNGVFGVLLMAALGLAGAAHWGWAVFWGLLAFVGGQALTGYLLQKRVQAAMGGVQQILLDGQKRLQQKVSQWQMRPPGSLKQAQLEMERDQRVFVERALEASKGLERFNRWVPLLDRQLATLRVQLHWIVKDFKQVDALLPRVLLLDPSIAALKIARLHMAGAEGGEKVFRKQAARLRYGQGALLYGLYAWTLVQKGDIDGAHKVLIEACGKMENETLKRNREHLANNRANQFSNAGLGDEWYALHLEQPKVKMQRQPAFGGRPF